jgi:hypothetical protein
MLEHLRYKKLIYFALQCGGLFGIVDTSCWSSNSQDTLVLGRLSASLKDDLKRLQK